jgi:hypothetical protein
MVSRAKFLEDIYSNDCQLLVKLPSVTAKKHVRELNVLKTLRDTRSKVRLPSWLNALLTGETPDEDEKTEVVKDLSEERVGVLSGAMDQIILGVKEYISTLKPGSRVLMLTKSPG